MAPELEWRSIPTQETVGKMLIVSEAPSVVRPASMNSSPNASPVEKQLTKAKQNSIIICRMVAVLATTLSVLSLASTISHFDVERMLDNRTEECLEMSPRTSTRPLEMVLLIKSMLCLLLVPKLAADLFCRASIMAGTGAGYKRQSGPGLMGMANSLVVGILAMNMTYFSALPIDYMLTCARAKLWTEIMATGIAATMALLLLLFSSTFTVAV